VLVVGEPGVGKSVAVKGAAHALAGEVLLINLRDLPRASSSEKASAAQR
jgi:MoxR-like ATPase